MAMSLQGSERMTGGLGRVHQMGWCGSGLWLLGAPMHLRSQETEAVLRNLGFMSTVDVRGDVSVRVNTSADAHAGANWMSGRVLAVQT